MSRTETLARQMYATFCLWRMADQGIVCPRWERLRSDMREEFLKLAERLTLEDR